LIQRQNTRNIIVFLALKQITCRSLRSDVSNFIRIRISNSTLIIEKGRHRKITLANRICPLCKSEVEDEFHFSMICDELKHIRNKFFQKLTDIV
jgi:DNA-binding XRE family transcriptional regulator